MLEEPGLLPRLRTPRASRLPLAELAGPLLAASLLLAGCGRSPATVPPAPRNGIDLVVTAAPTCPVQSAGQSCSRPLSARVVVRGSAGAVVTTVQSGGDGKARVPLQPGTYRLEPQGTGSAFPRPPPASTVTVAADSFTTVRIIYDTGIR